MRTSDADVFAVGEVWSDCAVGQRAYYATRALLQRGVRVRNISGGYRSYLAHRVARGRA